MAENAPLTVGYAFREKRNKSLFTPALREKGKQENIIFVKIDQNVPLVEQGKFDLLMHKLDGDDWERQLETYESTFPDTVIVDKFENVNRLNDRLEMLKVVAGLQELHIGAPIEAPKQLSIPEGTPPKDIPQIVKDSGIQLPVVSKPTIANGTLDAHQLCLVLTESALTHIQPPVVLQEFVNHGGVLFKLYLLGDRVMVFKRQSLPDIPKKAVEELLEEEAKELATGVKKEAPPDASMETLHQGEDIGAMIKKGAGIVEFNQISNVHMSEEEMNGRVVDPPPDLMQKLGLELRKRLGLQTFNVDILREEGSKDRYFVVDINYMPGYERLPDFEVQFLEFVRKQIHKRRLKLNLTEEERAAVKEQVKVRPEPPSTPYPALKSKKWVQVRAAFRLAGLKRATSASKSGLE